MVDKSAAPVVQINNKIYSLRHENLRINSGLAQKQLLEDFSKFTPLFYLVYYKVQKQFSCLHRTGGAKSLIPS